MDNETAEALAQLTDQVEDNKKGVKKRKSTEPPEIADVRRKSHNIIEQKRRQKINDKIDELKALLGSTYEHQNKATVLEGTIENIKSLRSVCTKLLAQHRQLQEEYMLLVAEQERLCNNRSSSARNMERHKSFPFPLPNGGPNGLPGASHGFGNNGNGAPGSQGEFGQQRINGHLPFVFSIPEDPILKDLSMLPPKKEGKN